MTQAAQTAKETSRKSQIGETYVCPRCKGEGYSIGWHVQFGTCFKCNGAGVVTKIDPNGTTETVKYLVKLQNGMVQPITTEDQGCENVSKTLWIGDNVTFKVGKYDWNGVVVGKCLQVYHNTNGLISEKKSKNFDNIKTY